MMRLVAITAAAVVLAAGSGTVDVASFLAAFGVVWLLERGARAFLSGHPDLGAPVRWARFLADFLWDLAKSNLVMAWDVVTPRDYHRVRMVEVPVGDLSEPEIVLLIHRITLTPGTLTCGLTEDGRHLLVHAMYGASGDVVGRLRRPVDILRGRR